MGNSLVALGIKNPVMESPIRRMATMRNLTQSNQINEMNINRAKQEQAAAAQAQKRQQGVNNIIKFHNGDVRAALPKIKQFSPDDAMEYEKGLAEIGKKTAEEQLKIYEVLVSEMEIVGRVSQSVVDEPTKNAAIDFLLQKGIIDQEQAQKQRATPFNPEANKRLQDSALTTDQYAKHEIALLKANKPDKPPLVAVKTVDAQGNPITKFVRKTEGAEYPSGLGQGKPSQAESSLSGEALLATLDAPTAELVRGITDYTLDASRISSIRSGRRERIVGLAKLYDRSFDMSQYDARKRLRGDFFSGKAAGNIRSLNTAVGHLESLRKAASNLENRPVQFWNMIANEGLSQIGDSRVVVFNNAANAVAGEMASIFKGTAGTDQEIKSWRQQLSSSQSPEQMNGAIDQLIELMASRIESLAGQWEAGMGKPKDFRFLNDKSAEILKAFGAESMMELDRIGARTTGEIKESDPLGIM